MRSRRLPAKPTLRLGNRTLAAHVANCLIDTCGGRVAAVVSHDEEVLGLPGNVAILRDRVQGRGPLEALAVGLRHAADQLVAVVGCDYPFLSRPLIGLLVDRLCHHDADAAVVRQDQQRHPLLAVYRPSVASTAEARLEGDRSLIGLLDSIQCAYVDVEEIRQIDPQLESLANVNTPEDYQRAQEIWARRNAAGG